MPTYKMRYFELTRGRIEHIRFMFAAAGVPLEDDVVKIEWCNWLEEVKPKQPFLNQLPVFFEDGKVLCTTHAIGRYVAKKLGFAGANDWESAQIDMYVDGYHDMFNAMTKIVPPLLLMGDQPKAQEIYDELVPEKVKPFMDKYEQFLKGKDWLVGEKASWADFAVAEILQRFEELFQPSLFEGYPTLKVHQERVYALPGIKEYIANRPETKF